MKVIGLYNTSIPQFLNLAQSACICENLRPKLRILVSWWRKPFI
ncbi:hypothetical protein D1AOALGA4SA_12205 [Olavius algarvensis Delta 1 endosymbiont]|nr:hypothetical protein D1AOALGA4SA_12205 [Olavius algarvensis Delta 1 endosymbiont]